MIMRISAVLFLLLSSTYTCTAGTDQNLIVETTNGKVSLSVMDFIALPTLCTLLLKVLGKYSDNGNSRVEYNMNTHGTPHGLASLHCLHTGFPGNSLWGTC